jgi:hypothetical protein
MSTDSEGYILCVGGTREHNAVKQDRFVADGLGKRTIPGDCYCTACGQLLPAWWNGGNPIPYEPVPPKP